MPDTMREVMHLLQQAFDAYVQRQEAVVEHLADEIHDSHALIRDMRAYINGVPGQDLAELLERAEKIAGKERKYS